ncbi:MAG: pitrilysin family protein [Pseudomonadota bacterium]
MKRYLSTVFLIVLIIGGFVVYQTHKNHFKDLPRVAQIDIKVQTRVVQNVPIWYVPNQDTDLVCFKISFKGAGAAQDLTPGATKMLASMLNEGTDDMDSETFQNFLLNHQIQLMPDYDADNFGITIRTVKSQLPDALEVMIKILSTLKLADADLDRNRDDMIVSLEQSKHDPFSLSADALKRLAYKKHPYFVSIDEQISGLKVLTSHDVRVVLKRFGQNNLLVTCAGNIDAPTMTNLVNALTMILPKEADLKPIPMAELDYQKSIHQISMPIPQSVIRFTMPAILLHDPDYYAYELLEGIFGGTAMKSRLFQDIREKRGLAYYAQTNAVNMERLDALQGSTGVATENEKAVVQLIKDNMALIQKEGVTAEELAFEKQHTSGTFALNFDSIRETVHTLAHLQLDGFPPTYVNDYAKHLDAVTLDQIKKVAQKYLSADKLIIVITGKSHVVAA